MASQSQTSPQLWSPYIEDSKNLVNIPDEGDFDHLPSTIPETQGMGGMPPIEPIPKKFIPLMNEVSESSLAEGFSWQPKETVRPGQFSERPKQKAPKAPLVPLPAIQEKPVSKGVSTGPNTPFNGPSTMVDNAPWKSPSSALRKLQSLCPSCTKSTRDRPPLRRGPRHSKIYQANKSHPMELKLPCLATCCPPTRTPWLVPRIRSHIQVVQ